MFEGIPRTTPDEFMRQSERQMPDPKTVIAALKAAGLPEEAAELIAGLAHDLYCTTMGSKCLLQAFMSLGETVDSLGKAVINLSQRLQQLEGPRH